MIFVVSVRGWRRFDPGYFDGQRHRLAAVAPVGEVPLIGKTAALARLDRLNGAVDAVEKNALVIGFFDQRQALAIGTQAGEAFEEFIFGKGEVSGDGTDLVIFDAHIAWPTAAVSAALALKENSWRRRRHGGQDCGWGSLPKLRQPQCESVEIGVDEC